MNATLGFSGFSSLRSLGSGSGICTGGAPAPSYQGAMMNGSL